MSCHSVDQKLVGPAFRDVAARYRGQPDAEAKLIEKVRRGGSGTWGSVPMPAAPGLAEADAQALVRWILGSAP
jgi:cytochrome c